MRNVRNAAERRCLVWMVSVDGECGWRVKMVRMLSEDAEWQRWGCSGSFDDAAPLIHPGDSKWLACLRTLKSQIIPNQTDDVTYSRGFARLRRWLALSMFAAAFEMLFGGYWAGSFWRSKISRTMPRDDWRRQIPKTIGGDEYLKTMARRCYGKECTQQTHLERLPLRFYSDDLNHFKQIAVCWPLHLFRMTAVVSSGYFRSNVQFSEPRFMLWTSSPYHRIGPIG